MYVIAPMKITPKLANAGRLGHGRPVKSESQMATRIGVELRNTMNVSTFAYWSESQRWCQDKSTKYEGLRGVNVEARM